MSWHVRNPDGTHGPPLIGFASLTYRDVALAPSGWVLSIESTNVAVPILLQRGAGIIHTGAPYGDLTGTVNPGPDGESRYSRISTGGVDLITFYGHTDKSMFWNRVAVIGNIEDDPSYVVASGAAHTVFGTMFDDQFGSSGYDPTRHNPAHDTITGTPTTVIEFDFARFQNLGEQLARVLGDADLSLISIYDDDLVKFGLRESIDNQQILTLANGGLSREQVDVSAISASRVYVLGGGQGPSRDIYTVDDDDSDVWSLMEISIDRRDLAIADAAALQAAGEEVLDLGSVGRTVEIAASAAVQVGDKVRTEVDGVLLERYVVAQTITIDPTQEYRTFDLGLTLTGDEIPQAVQTLTGGRRSNAVVQDGPGSTEAVTITSGNWGNRAGYMPLTVTRSGNTVTLCGVLNQTSTQTPFETIATLPAEYRPPARVSGVAIDGTTSTAVRRFDVFSNGAVTMSGTAVVGHLGVSISWPV